jgi:hypothetical protein
MKKPKFWLFYQKIFNGPNHILTKLKNFGNSTTKTRVPVFWVVVSVFGGFHLVAENLRNTWLSVHQAKVMVETVFIFL